MRKFAVILVLSVIIPLSAFPEITLGYCLDKAMENYPLIKKYGIVEKTSALSRPCPTEREPDSTF